MSKGFTTDYHDILLRFNNGTFNRRINLADFSDISFSGKQLKVLGADNEILTIVPSSLVDYLIFVDQADKYPGKGIFADVEFYFSNWHSISCFLDVSDYSSIEDYFFKNAGDDFFEVFSNRGERAYINRTRALFARLTNYSSDLFKKKNPGAIFKRVNLFFGGFKLACDLDFSGMERDSDLFGGIKTHLIGINSEFNGCRMPGVVLIGDSWCSKEFISP